MQDKLITVQEAARLLSLHPQTIYRKIKAGDLESVSIPGTRAVRLRESDVLDILSAVYVKKQEEAETKNLLIVE